MVGKKSDRTTKDLRSAFQRSWRHLLSGNIPLQVDLENGQLTTPEGSGLDQLLNLDVKNVDQVILDYIDPADRVRVQQSLQLARNGKEKPIIFNFVHPSSARRHSFEYRYEIVYVKYASTCLRGSLVRVVDQN